MIRIHCGIVWVVDIRGGWYFNLKAFPEAVKKVGKEYEPDMAHPSVLKFVKDNA